MARPLRILLPGGLYHLIARGNAREPCFRAEDDRRAFLATLEHVLERFGWLIYAYCLMENHYHLVAETPLPNLPAGMRQLNGLYARRFNIRHGRCGHVFQARYRSILVDGDAYLLEVCRYVVLNPIRAGICAEPGAYRWSSYRATNGEAKAELPLALQSLLALFAPRPALARARYREFVRAGIVEALEQRVRGERLGGEAFLRERFGYEPPLPEIPRRQVEPLPPSLAEIFAAGNPVPVATAYRRHGYTIGQIAAHLGCHYSTVSRRLRREERVAKCKT
jgi:putative transposase